MTTASEVLSCPAQGLGFPNNSAQHALPPFFNMIQENLLDQNMFSVWLNPDLAAADAGEVTFGGLDPSRFSGNLTRWTKFYVANMQAHQLLLLLYPGPGVADIGGVMLGSPDPCHLSGKMKAW